MKKRVFVLFLLGLAGGLFAGNRPNIIFFFSDDHSFQTIGAYGVRLQKLNPTPNLDRLATEGMRFDRCYVGNSICCPARATLLTGKHSHKNGVLANTKKFNHDQPQFQKNLKQAGYQTVLVGKMHMGGNWQGLTTGMYCPGRGIMTIRRFMEATVSTGQKGMFQM